jgi:hypothetical protein
MCSFNYFAPKILTYIYINKYSFYFKNSWEFGLPVVIKHFSEPESHALTQTAMHPSGKYFAGQASNNCVI